MSSWSEKATYLFKESFGFRGAKNITAWAVAGGVAYFWWVRPEQLRRQEERENCLKGKLEVIARKELPAEVLKQVEEHVQKNS